MDYKNRVKKLTYEKLSMIERRKHQEYIDYMLHNGFFDIIYYLENKNDFFM